MQIIVILYCLGSNCVVCFLFFPNIFQPWLVESADVKTKTSQNFSAPSYCQCLVGLQSLPPHYPIVWHLAFSVRGSLINSLALWAAEVYRICLHLQPFSSHSWLSPQPGAADSWQLSGEPARSNLEALLKCRLLSLPSGGFRPVCPGWT